MYNNVTVIKAIKRTYGYTLQWVNPNNRPSWVIGPKNTWAWYRYRRDAQKQADYYNTYQS